jgi:hypothetical protein
MAFTTFRLLLMGNIYSSSIAFANRISFFKLRQVKSIILTIVISFPLTVTLFSSNAQAKICGPICKRIKEAKEALKNIEVNGEISLDDRDMEELFNRIEALVNLTTVQASALTRTVGDEYTESMKETFYELEEYTKTLNNVGKELITQADKATEQRIDQVDRVTEARIRQTLDGIERETLLISQEMTKQILAIDEAVKSSSSHISYEVQQATITASDELARLLGVTREEVDYLLASSEERLLHILSYASDEINDLVKGISEETQKNINLGFDRAEELTILGFDEFEDSTHIVGGEVKAIITQWEGSSKVLLANAANHAIDITDNLSDESKEVIEFGADELKELSSHIAEEVLIIQEEIKISRMETIEFAGKTAIVFINRTADLVLAVGASFAGIIFLFVSSYGWGNNFLKNPKLPENYAVRVIIFSFMGMNLVAAFVPFLFLRQEVRTQVLSPLNQVKTLGELIPERKFSQSPDRRIQGRQPDKVSQELPTSTPSPQQENTDFKPSCGQYSAMPEDIEFIQVYKIFVEYTPETLVTIKSNYCKDAWQPSTDVIQVAVFDDHSKAEKFSTFLSNQLNTVAQIKESSLKNPKYRGSYSDSISQREALDLIERWVSAKSKIAAPPFDMDLAYELLIGDDLQKQIKYTDWYRNNNTYYTYQYQNVDFYHFYPGETQASIKVFITEKRTFCHDGKIADDPNNYDVHETRLYTYNLQRNGNQWKIENHDSKRQGKAKPNLEKTCNIN